MKQNLIILLMLCLTVTHIFADDISNADNKFKAFLKSLTPAQKTILAKRLKQENAVANNDYGIVLYHPNYILPFYYSSAPYHDIYKDHTPDNQIIMPLEAKFQISFRVPVVQNIFSPKNSINVAYTQDSFWQVYARSQFFRETNYMPELFFRREQNNNILWQTGIVHQSNGRGGNLERSWNRLYGELIYSTSHWTINIKPWMLIFKSRTSDVHNHDIAHYLGNEKIILSYKYKNTIFSLVTRNSVESHFARGAETLDWSFPLYSRFRGLVRLFSGYGQSLIEYDHYTNSFAFGIELNDWI